MIKIRTINQLEKIFLKGRVKGIETSGKMLANERFAFQVAFRTMRHLRDLTLCVESEISEHVSVYFQKHITAFPILEAKCGVDTDDYVQYSKTHLYPDVLIPQNACACVAYKGFNTAYYVEIYAPKGIKAGKYDLRISLKNATGEVLGTCIYTLTVYAAMLSESDLFVTNWFHYDCLSDHYNIPLFTAEYYDMLRSYIENYVAHGNNAILTPLFTPCLDTNIGTERKTAQLIDVCEKDGKYAFDFAKLEYFMDFMDSLGIRYFEFSPFATQWGGKSCPKVEIRTEKGIKKAFGWDCSSVSEEYFDFLGAFLPKLDAFLRSKNYQDRCYVHITDEPCEGNLPRYGKLKSFLKKYLHNYRFMDAISSFKFADYIDIPVVSINHVEPFVEAGRDCFVYYCCANAQEYVSNRFIVMPLLRTRILGLQLYLNGSKGFLHWGHNFYYSALSLRRIDPFTELDADGRFPAGDCFVVYPGSDRKPLNSLRHKAFCGAMDDYRLLKLLEGKIGRRAVCELLEKNGVHGFKRYPHSEEWYLALKNEIYELLKAE